MSKFVMHLCEVEGCGEKINRNLLMCRRHWFKVPRHIRARVFVEYRKGFSKKYFEVVKEATAFAEGKRP